MKKYSLLFLLFICFFSFAQNAKKTTKTKTTKKVVTTKLPKDVQIWTVDAQRAKCEGATTMQCLLVKKQSDKDFNLFYDNIDGFDYQEGFVYTIAVSVINADSEPSVLSKEIIYKYVLYKIISKKPIAGYSNTTIDNKKPLSGMNVSMTKTLIINEEKTQCEGNPNAKCLLIKKEGAKEFEVFYQGIEGFVFEEGYRQTILVNERHVANQMVKQVEPIYTLVSVVKKELINTVKKDTAISIQPKTVLDKKWFLRKMKDSDTTSFEITDNAVYVEFNSAENRITGKAPCNTYFGGFKSDFISAFQTSAIASTKMYCDNMKFEDIYFTLLQNADTFEIKDGKLSLSKGKRLLLVFE